MTNRILDNQYAPSGNRVLDLMLSSWVADTVPPVMVGSLAFSNITQTSFRVDWQAATDNVGVVSYEVQINNGGYTNIGNVLYISESGLSAGTGYAIDVRAKDAAGNYSSALSGAASTLSAPTTITGVMVVPANATGSRQFAAIVQGTNNPSQNVSWSVSGGGTIDFSGYLTAPAPIATQQNLVVTATSLQDGTKLGTATVLIAAQGTVPGNPPGTWGPGASYSVPSFRSFRISLTGSQVVVIAGVSRKSQLQIPTGKTITVETTLANGNDIAAGTADWVVWSEGAQVGPYIRLLPPCTALRVTNGATAGFINVIQ